MEDQQIQDFSVVLTVATNKVYKEKYGESFPSLPRILRKRKPPLQNGHTESVLRGYGKRVHNFLSLKEPNLQHFN